MGRNSDLYPRVVSWNWLSRISKSKAWFLSCFDLNNEMLKLAHQEAMHFGNALEQILLQIVEANPKYGPVQLIKVDISDGFYRVCLNLTDIPKLAVSIPSLKGEEPLLAFPLVLPMGWTEYPPYFCAATETVTDLANQRAQNNWKPPHCLDAVADSPSQGEATSDNLSTLSTTRTTFSQTPENTPHRNFRKHILQRFDVFVDGSIGMGQGNRLQLQNLRRILLHTLDAVFRPLDESDGPHGKEPASVKKLQQGDAHWETHKLILGWVVDTLKMTIELPSHRKERLQEILESFPITQKRCSIKRWQ
jgi:hypothetical protein